MKQFNNKSLANQDVSEHLIGKYSHSTSNVKEFSALKEYLKSNSNIVYGGCFTGSCILDGDKFLETVSDLTNSTSYGNQGLSKISKYFFNDKKIGSFWDGWAPYYNLANSGGGKWTMATPFYGSNTIANLKINNKGVISTTRGIFHSRLLHVSRKHR